MRRISSQTTTFMHLLGFVVLAVPFYMATTPVLMTGRGDMRHAASPTERWVSVCFLGALSLFLLWQTLMLQHVQRGQHSFLVSRFGGQKTIRFQDVVGINILKFPVWRGYKTACIQYRDQEGKFRSVMFLVTRGLSQQAMWLEELQETIFRKDSRTFEGVSKPH
jgi:hypothetical protein